MSTILFRPFKIAKNELNDLSISEGQFIITTDTQEMFLDISNNSRIVLGSSVGSFSIAANDWSLNSTTGLYEATIVNSTITANDLTDIAVDAVTYDVAAAAGMKSYTTEISGGIKVFADSAPEGTISGKYTIMRGSV